MTIQIDKKGLLKHMQIHGDKIMDLLISFNVPDSVQDDDAYEQFLLPNSKGGAKNAITNGTNKKSPAQLDELEERLNTIRNKLKAKKRPMTDRAQKKRDAKKLRKNKEFKKVLVSATKSIKNQNTKAGVAVKSEGADDAKSGIKPVSVRPVFNAEGKMVFSKFDFAAHPGAKGKKSHQNPREMLKKINETKKKLSELKEQGESEKASELHNELAWKKAFDKIEGKKVKDDPKLLVKAIKKRKVEKKKSKQQWTERKEKVESEISQRQKKRTENLGKRIKDKKNKKLKNLTKRGRVVPGF